MADASHVFRLVYYSHNRIDGDPEAITREIEGILAASRRNNEAASVTGALIFNTGVFAQVLEGPRANIEATFERIQRDPRHGDVQILAFGAVEERAFRNWSMAHIGETQTDQVLFGHICEATSFDAKRLEGERVFKIMTSIALDEERRRAA